ncbi:MAG TPA: prepilin-type N-terminal cleavage/methylation domain-containing protein [Armatimonadota bacterium]|nr:prepilin-type N-terminal cleavage/methylation domain-containing protein [Armatimonadota bacterium]
MQRFLSRQRGFTLIEMLIVITIIAILALIVIPRLTAAGRRGKEASLRADLKQLRDAIERFEANTAAWPPSLADLMAADGSAVSADVDGRGMSVDRAGYEGPYLRTGSGSLPADPFTGAADWTYNSSTGEVHSSSTLTALDASTYSIW